MSTWRRSSACLDNACVEVCESSACVETLFDGDEVLVRNSAEPARVARFTREEWAAFVVGVKRGEFG